MEEKKEFYKSLWKLVLPLAFQNLMTTLVSATDALVLARVDQYSVAAVSLATEINFVMNLFMGTIIAGISIMAAQYMGKGDIRTVKNLMGMALRYNVLLAVIFFAAAKFAPEQVMAIYTSDAGLIEIGAGYLEIASWSYLMSAAAQCYMCVMKISGGAAVSAAIAAITAVVDVVVDIFLVYGLFGIPKMGAKGTAISTVSVCFVELVGVLIYSYGKDRIRPGVQNLRYFSRELEADFRKISLPVLMSYLVWGVGFSMSAAVMGHVSADASSAYAIAATVRSLFTCFIHGVGTGAGIIVGKDLGSGDLERAKRNGGRLSRTALMCGICSGIVLYLAGPLVLKFFIMNDVTKGYLQQMLPVCSLYLVALSITVIVLSSIFPAGGDSKFDAQITAVTMWLIALPLGCLFAFVFKLPVVVVYFALCLDEFVKSLFIYPRYKKYIWLKNLTRDFEKADE